MNPVSKYQFAAFRIVFGLYLCVHFSGLIPYGTELFSDKGVVADSTLNFTHGILPNPLERWDSPGSVTTFLSLLLLISAAYTLGIFRQGCALLLWFGWACLYNRNNLIGNPSIPYVGLLLLFSAIIPPGEPALLRQAKTKADWRMPASLFVTAWMLMAAGYSFSGIVKLSSPSWVDGTALIHVASNPLARPGCVREIFLGLPTWVLRCATWGSLVMEIAFLPLCLHPKTRPLAWLSMVAMHFGILSIVDFADLTFGMLMIHLFTFDPSWLPPRVRTAGIGVVLFDGVCGLCDRTVQFLLDQDTMGSFKFAPLQGETAAAVLARHPGIERDLQTIIVVRSFGTPEESVAIRSQAVLEMLDDLGGFWRVVSGSRVVPQAIRDVVYRWVARNRYKWFGRYDACRLPEPSVRSRFLP
ncbi:lipase maturation factor family protein [bacterium]|nr:lipase maturation factor family protein [bacterium]